jgi:threonyl-tRNA synthetase
MEMIASYNTHMPEDIEKIRHSLAHLLASAVMEFWPGAKLAIGPAIENGFYYDIEMPKNFTAEDLSKIEARMKELIKENQKFVGKKISKVAAKKLFKQSPYKLEIIKELPGTTVGTYHNGNFIDLCKGGHVENTSEIDPNSFKLTKIAGAYWRGDEKNKMLTRIYGVAFTTAKELQDYVKMMEEAEKRDHRKLGKELNLFTFSDLVGAGLPLYMPKGTILRDQLAGFSEELQKAKGFQKVWIPHITKIDLYKTSGHWDKFGDELFLVKSQESSDEFALKPMNCPHHTQIYAAQPRSYRDLPLRFMETTTCYRDEKTGELAGLTRVRSLTQDDAHIFCRMDQVEQEFENIMEMIKALYGALGMEFKARLSFSDPKNPKKYLGDKEQWKNAEKILEAVAKKLHLDYSVTIGEAAFYGPKIDIMVIDALGREWQCATEQLDFVQPMRFGLEYTDEDGSKKTPVMIHKALLGTIDRFLGVYIEHTAGAFPLWLSPVQVAIAPISEKHTEYAMTVADTLKAENIRVQLFNENETLGKKIRGAETQKIPYLLIIGDKEIQANAVSVRARGKGDMGQMNGEEFIGKIKEEIHNKK